MTLEIVNIISDALSFAVAHCFVDGQPRFRFRERVR